MANKMDMKGGFKAKNPLKTFKRLMGYILKDHWFGLIMVLVTVGLSSYASVQSMAMIEDLITEIGLKVNNSSQDLSGITQIMIKMIALFGGGVLGALLYQQIMVYVSQGLLRSIRNEMFIKMQTLPIKYFDTHTFGETMSHYTNDTDTLEDFISMGIPNIFSSLMTIVFCLVQMIIMSWQMTLIVLATIFLMFFFIKIIGGKSAFYFAKQQACVGKVNGYIEEMLSGQKVVKVFSYEERNKEAFDKLNNELYDNSKSANTYANIFMPIMANLTYVQYVIVAGVGGILANNGLLIVNTTGDYVVGAIALVSAFLLLSKTLTRPINMVSQQFNSIVTAIAGAERIFELVDTKKEADDGYVTLVKVEEKDGEIVEVEDNNGFIGKDEQSFWAWKHPHGDGTLTYAKLKGDVLLKDVDFSYDGVKQVLHDVTVDVKAGQKVAIIGKTGAGKTTISNLINRFYDIDDGKIRYDGININKIKKADLRKSLGVVLQEINLFTDTVMENIRYGNPYASDEEVIEAAKLVHADDFITRLPDGYNTMLTLDGANLSQGQRQLLSIARVAVANPPVMILDEATSSIDTRTEVLVQQGMDNLMKGRTVFVIAHRLSTVKNADNILVMEGGRIIEQGNHKELMDKKGVYYSLYQN